MRALPLEPAQNDRWWCRTGSLSVHPRRRPRSGHRALVVTRPHPLYNLLNGFLQDVEVRLGINAYPDSPGNQGQEYDDFPQAEIRKMQVLPVGDLAQHSALVEPQEIRRAEDH